MRVLWFAIRPGLYDSQNGQTGGSWISALQEAFMKCPEYELGIAFEHTDDCFKKIIDGVSYYPMNPIKSLKNKVLQFISAKYEEKNILPLCKRVVDDFKPEIIHVFGSEWPYALVQDCFPEIPVVIHMQGSLPPYFNAGKLPGYNIFNIFLYNGLNIFRTLKLYYRKAVKDRIRYEREIQILNHCKYVLGRTDWDYNITRLYAPKSKYFICNEAIRTSFINKTKYWKYNDKPHRLRLVTCGSGSGLKGTDVMLKTAYLLKNYTDLDFEWMVVGPQPLIGYFERFEKIRYSDVNIQLLGSMDSDSLAELLIHSDIYVHTAYIDNSPNSLCEAQILGIPIISTYVGGIPSLIDNGKDGVLVPHNEPHNMAMEIYKLYKSKEKMIYIGSSGRERALKRHNINAIINNLRTIYKNVIEDNKTIID